jgi:hypothetical protein
MSLHAVECAVAVVRYGKAFSVAVLQHLVRPVGGLRGVVEAAFVLSSDAGALYVGFVRERPRSVDSDRLGYYRWTYPSV